MSESQEFYIILATGCFTIVNTIIACFLHMRIKSGCMSCEPANVPTKDYSDKEPSNE